MATTAVNGKDKAEILGHLAQASAAVHQDKFAEAELEVRLAQVAIQRAFKIAAPRGRNGCKATCPTCGANCDLVHAGRPGRRKKVHACEAGHEWRPKEATTS